MLWKPWGSVCSWDAKWETIVVSLAIKAAREGVELRWLHLFLPTAVQLPCNFAPRKGVMVTTHISSHSSTTSSSHSLTEKVLNSGDSLISSFSCTTSSSYSSNSHPPSFLPLVLFPWQSTSFASDNRVSSVCETQTHTLMCARIRACALTHTFIACSVLVLRKCYVDVGI